MEVRSLKTDLASFLQLLAKLIDLLCKILGRFGHGIETSSCTDSLLCAIG